MGTSGKTFAVATWGWAFSFLFAAAVNAVLIDDFSDAAASSNVWNTHPDAGGPAGWSRITFDDDEPGMAYLQDGDQDGGANGTWMMNQTTSDFTAGELSYKFDYTLLGDYDGSGGFYLTPDADTQIFTTTTFIRFEMFEHVPAGANPTNWVEFGLFANDNTGQVPLWGGRSDLGDLASSGTVTLRMSPTAGSADYELIISPDTGTVATVSGSLSGDAGLTNAAWTNGVYIGFQAAKREGGSGTHGFAVDNVKVVPPVEPVAFTEIEVTNMVALAFQSQTNVNYELQYTANPGPTNWLSTGLTIAGDDNQRFVNDPAGASTQKTYRVAATEQ